MPYIWVTNVTGLMSDEDHCRWAAHFKARNTYQKVDDDFDSKEFRAKHKLARDQRADELRDEGWVIKIEGETDFKLKGESLTLGGRPDIVAVKHEEKRIHICDPKTGRKYLKHWYQLAIYMHWIRKVLGRRFADYEVTGELGYYDFEEATEIVQTADREGAISSQAVRTLVPRLTERITVTEADITPAHLAVIIRELQTVGMALPPEKAPSPLECLYCNIPKSECPEKLAERPEEVEVKDF